MSDPRDDNDEGPRIDDAALQARRRAFEERLAAQRAAMPIEDRQPNRTGAAGMAQGLKIASEFVAGVLVGAGIGYLIDLGLGTAPFGLIIFLLFGFAAGVLNVLRAVGKGPPPSGPTPADG
ncbi:AtpZ/AtpI family protein [Antarcticirhabdus aurantiaca]|uniref:AtpZ/AtpI family protein n=1 Tax=Antarcticirhabdus aurantiaca TaxID=2606717 RepID=A0ACD4NU14_9HYPH|nr:AtpZ/AtpI family protein [Antarcticirhabdus aurantiaca]WAJ30273.1 AtpZ/AtpI family protein [Jeongeuplla avenae]